MWLWHLQHAAALRDRVHAFAERLVRIVRHLGVDGDRHVGHPPASSFSRIQRPRRIGSVVVLAENAISHAGCVRMPLRLGTANGCTGW